jgi:cytosine/adenosine deaminase-related metal-dependent hydrolase
MTGATPFRGDVLIEDDRIAAVGTGGVEVDADVVDVSGRIVLPGLVDTHRHLWQSALRGIASDWTLGEYFARLRGGVAGHFRPQDTYAGTLLGAVEALDAGGRAVFAYAARATPRREGSGPRTRTTSGGCAPAWERTTRPG